MGIYKQPLDMTRSQLQMLGNTLHLQKEEQPQTAAAQIRIFSDQIKEILSDKYQAIILTNKNQALTGTSYFRLTSTEKRLELLEITETSKKNFTFEFRTETLKFNNQLVGQDFEFSFAQKINFIVQQIMQNKVRIFGEKR